MPPKKTTKKVEPTAEERALNEVRDDKEKNEASAARIKKAAEEDAARREEFDTEDKKKIEKAVKECVGHLQTLNDLRLAREVLRRLLRRVEANTDPKKI